MAVSNTADIRNIVLLGHTSSGKTAIAESMLFKAGVTNRLGSSDDGSSMLDFSDLEKDKKHTIDPSLVSFEYSGKKINLIDTPGYPDFIAGAISSISGADTCILVVSATGGIEVNTRKLKLASESADKAMAIVINKIDADNIDLSTLMETVEETFGHACLPINLPSANGTSIVDCFKSTSGDVDFGDPQTLHEQLIENVIESDEEMMESYLNGEEISPAKLAEAFGTAMMEKSIIPIFFTNAKNSVGIDELLDAVVSYFPCPAIAKHETIFSGDGEATEEVDYRIDSNEPFIGHVFKITTNPFVGKLAWIKVLQGTAKSDTQYALNLEKKTTKIGHLYSVQGGNTEDLPVAVAGDIFSLAKVDEIFQGTILHEQHIEFKIEPLRFPTPMYALAITPKKRGDEKKLSEALHRLSDEDLTFQPSRDNQTNESIVNGMGEMHLKTALAKMKAYFHIEVDTKTPKIPYRETITMAAEGHCRHKKQTGGAGQFGEVYLRVEPLAEDTGLEYVSELFGESIPRQFLPAIEKGVVEAMGHGAIAGYPLQDIKVAITDGKHHPVDSKEIAFKMAGRNAFLDAIVKAKPVILEPIVNMEITVPSENMGDIASDLSGKRGQVQGQEMLPGDMISIRAIAPLACVRQYNSLLKSITGGQGSFTMEFSHYAGVPGNVQQEIINESKRLKEEHAE